MANISCMCNGQSPFSNHGTSFSLTMANLFLHNGRSPFFGKCQISLWATENLFILQLQIPFLDHLLLLVLSFFFQILTVWTMHVFSFGLLKILPNNPWSWFRYVIIANLFFGLRQKIEYFLYHGKKWLFWTMSDLLFAPWQKVEIFLPHQKNDHGKFILQTMANSFFYTTRHFLSYAPS